MNKSFANNSISNHQSTISTIVVKTTPVAVAREERQLTLLTLLHRPNRILKLLNMAPHQLRLPRRIRRLRTKHIILRRRLHIQARRKRPVSRAAQHNCPNVRVRAELLKHAPKLEPHRLRKGVELLGPVDLHVCYQRRWRADDEELVRGVARERRGGCC